MVTRRRTFEFKGANHAENQKCIYDISCAKRWCQSNSHLIKEHRLSSDAKNDLEVLAIIEEIDKRHGIQPDSGTKTAENSNDMGRSVTEMFGSLTNESNDIVMMDSVDLDSTDSKKK